MKIVALVQARMGSKRFPQKVLQSLGEHSVIETLLRRLSKSKLVHEIVLATSQNTENDTLAELVSARGFRVFRGSEENVLQRFYQAAKSFKADVIVRITGDCPLVDAEIVDLVIEKFRDSAVDYVSNIQPATFPDGLDVEVFSMQALEKAYKAVENPRDKEHVTTWIRESGQFSTKNIEYKSNESDIRWTLDEKEDLEVLQNVFNHFSPDIYFSWKDVHQLQKHNPSLFQANVHLKRNEGAQSSSGQKLWHRAKKVIPGGNMLLSKRAEMFLPDQWPAYFSKSKGCRVWDLEGNEFIDTCIMGVGTNVLGYGHPEVDEAVLKTVKDGTMSTLNCPEEVYLAEKLVEMHPWGEMVRLARTGGEANAIAIRIARAASRKDNIAICGYHGWHDWYLSANIGEDDSLSGHILPGLEPRGVPKALKNTVFPFQYNDIDQLERLLREQDIGIIKMEVSRNKGPENQFLEKVRKLADDNEAILIFDECTSGFRETFGGLHKQYNVEPDMAVFGKTLGNGYAITAVVGKREIMESAQVSFISSTFWTERIGPVAALKTLEVMEREESWQKISGTGRWVKQNWQRLADKFELEIDIFGLDALAGFSFKSKNNLKYKTFITQEMLSRGYLASTLIYTCIDHTPEILNHYFENLAQVFEVIQECENGRKIDSLLKGPVCHTGFQRLN